MNIFARGHLAKGSRVIPLIFVIAFVAPACEGDQDQARRPRPAAKATSTAPPTPSPGQTPGAARDTAENRTGEEREIGGVKTVVRGQASTLPGFVNIEARDNFFKPNILTGVSGTAIVATIKNDGKELHNFSVTGQDVSQDMKAGEAPSVAFTFPGSGKVVFFCKYHRDDGMVGELQVT